MQQTIISPTTAAIRIEQLRRTFGEIVAVEGLDLTIPSGLIYGLLGPNGAGKSTTIKMLTTILPPTSGKAFVAGYNIVTESQIVRRKIGYVPQMLSADGALSGYENLMLSAKLYGMEHSERKPRIDTMLELMGLTDASTRLVKTYSGGMIRRLELAQAMLHHPSVLFLDEPTIGLDPVARRSVWEKLHELQQTYRTTILITTHDMEEADELCDELAIMHRGKLAVSGRPSDLKASIGEDANLNDVFIYYSGASASLDEGGTFRDIRQTRNTARRLG